MAFAGGDHAIGATAPTFDDARTVKGLGNERISQLREVRTGKLRQCHSGRSTAVTLYFDPVIEHGNRHIPRVVRVIAVHDGIQEDLPQGIQRNRKPVLAIDAIRRKARTQRHAAFKKRGPSRTLCPMRQDLAVRTRDLWSAEVIALRARPVQPIRCRLSSVQTQNTRNYLQGKRI